MNKVILMGRLTRDPEVRYSAGDNSMAIARYTLAVDRRFRRDGDSGSSADFIGCVAFGRSAEFAEKLLENSGVYDLYLQEKPMLQLQFRYEKQELVFVTGITHAEFTMDKRIEFAWDAAVEQYVRSLGVGAERG